MDLKKQYQSLFAKLQQANEQSIAENSSSNPLYELAGAKSTQDLLSGLSDLEKQLKIKFPESYKVFLETIGLGWFSNDHNDIGLYARKDLIDFNIGEDKYPELSDYIVFGEDGGTYSYIFDPGNKLQKGANAVFRIRRDELDDDYAIFLATDFAGLFEQLVNNQKLSETWLMDESNPEAAESCSNQLRESPPVLPEIEISDPAKIARIKKLMAKLKEKNYEIFHELDRAEILSALPALQQQQNMKYPASYLDFMTEICPGMLKNDHMLIDFFGDDGLAAHNPGGKSAKAFLKGHLLFGLGYSSTLYFLDLPGVLGKGAAAIFAIDWHAKDTGNARFLAKDFEELVELFVKNKKPKP